MNFGRNGKMKCRRLVFIVLKLKLKRNKEKVFLRLVYSIIISKIVTVKFCKYCAFIVIVYLYRHIILSRKQMWKWLHRVIKVIQIIRINFFFLVTYYLSIKKINIYKEKKNLLKTELIIDRYFYKIWRKLYINLLFSLIFDLKNNKKY